MLQSVPTYGSVALDGRVELLCIASQFPDDLVFITNNWISVSETEEETMSSQGFQPAISGFLPFMPPSIKDTANFIRKNGIWLDPNVQRRSSLSVIGCTSVVANSSVFDPRTSFLVFTETSAGDVFCRQLNKKISDKEVTSRKYTLESEWSNLEEENAFQKLATWERKVKKQTEKKVANLKVTGEFNSNSLFECEYCSIRFLPVI